MQPVKVSDIVSITLADGQHYSYSEGGETDEGFDTTHYHYERQDEIIVLDITRDARDCDGPLRQHTRKTWPVDGPVNDAGFPLFEDQHSEVHDAYAAAMNY